MKKNIITSLLTLLSGLVLLGQAPFNNKVYNNWKEKDSTQIRESFSEDFLTSSVPMFAAIKRDSLETAYSFLLESKQTKTHPSPSRIQISAFKYFSYKLASIAMNKHYTELKTISKSEVAKKISCHPNYYLICNRTIYHVASENTGQDEAEQIFQKLLTALNSVVKPEAKSMVILHTNGKIEVR